VRVALLVVGAQAVDADRALDRRLPVAADPTLELGEAAVDGADEVARVGDLEADRRMNGIDGPRPGRDDLAAVMVVWWTRLSFLFCELYLSRQQS
jgi:hypothetical protein